jgi:hypothetical protein
MGENAEFRITDEMIEAGLLWLCSELPNYDFSHAEKRVALRRVLHAIFSASNNEDIRSLADSLSTSDPLSCRSE